MMVNKKKETDDREAKRRESMGEEPVADPGIEIVHDLPVERMACVVVEVKFRTGNGGGHFPAHPGRGENVVFPPDDQRRTGDFAELGEDIVPRAGGGLGFERMKRLGIGIDIGLGPSIDEPRVGFVIVPERLGENEELDPLHELGRSEPRLAVGHMLEDRLRIPVAPGPGTHQYGAADFGGMPQGKLLGNDAAHGNPDNTGTGNAEGVQQPGVIIRHHGTAVGAFRFVRESDTTVVTEDAPKMLRPVVGMGFPDAAGSGDPHDEEHRVTGTALIIIHLDSVGFDVGHCGVGRVESSACSRQGLISSPKGASGQVFFGGAIAPARGK